MFAAPVMLPPPVTYTWSAFISALPVTWTAAGLFESTITDAPPVTTTDPLPAPRYAPFPVGSSRTMPAAEYGRTIPLATARAWTGSPPDPKMLLNARWTLPWTMTSAYPAGTGVPALGP